MAFTNPTTPNLADFATYVVDQGITTTYLPANSPYLSYALNFALQVALIPPGSMGVGLSGDAPVYVIAAYNLGVHQLLKIAPDQTGQTFFADQRKAFKLLQFQAGPVSASSDNSTSQTLAVADFIKGMTFSSLDLLRTPWGREYLDYAQQYGQTIVGVS